MAALFYINKKIICMLRNYKNEVSTTLNRLPAKSLHDGIFWD